MILKIFKNRIEYRIIRIFLAEYQISNIRRLRIEPNIKYRIFEELRIESNLEYRIFEFSEVFDSPTLEGKIFSH